MVRDTREPSASICFKLQPSGFFGEGLFDVQSLGSDRVARLPAQGKVRDTDVTPAAFSATLLWAGHSSCVCINTHILGRAVIQRAKNVANENTSRNPESVSYLLGGGQGLNNICMYWLNISTIYMQQLILIF